MPLRYKVILCFVALGQVVGLALLFLGMAGNLESVPNDADGDDSTKSGEDSKRKTDFEAVGIDPVLLPKQVVLMIVDALRVDMMTENNFPFLLNSLKNYKKTGVLLYNVTVDSPTVTLPRVKTLVTGRSPTYLDILKNLQTSDNSMSSNRLAQDNIIKRLRENRADVNVCFFGDETWLRLFPPESDGTSKFFRKWEGVTSFFVKDFEEVDKNVTRNLDKIEDCQFLILHYLGLDHIGHIHGPTERPDLIQNKLREMDKVIQKLYIKGSRKKGISDKSVILVTGDHGMHENGGHGGSSFEEITTPLAAIISGVPHMRNLKPVVSSIHQVDFAPTLAALWRLSTPQGSQGKIILDIVESFQSSQQLAHTYKDNCEHLMKMLGEARAAATYRLWLNEISKLENPLSVTKYVELEHELFSALRTLKMEQSNISGRYVYGVVLLIVVESVLLFLVSRSLSVVWNGISYALMLSIFPPLITYFSSSFIEEEHYIRYFTVSCIMLTSCSSSFPTDFTCVWGLVKVLFYHRILTSFNQTGDKWSHLPDLNDTIMDENLTWLSALIGILLVWRFLAYSGRSSKLATISLLFTYGCKTVINSDALSQMWPFLIFEEVRLQQITFLVILLNFFVTILQKSVKESVFTAVLLLVLHLQRQQNMLVLGLVLSGLLEIVSLFHYQQVLKIELQANLEAAVPLSTQVTIVWFAHAAFFYQGNSNGLATIDVSAGYIGFGSFASSIVIGALIFLNTYGNPLIIYLHFATIRSENSSNSTSSNNSSANGNSSADKGKISRPDRISNPLPVISLLSNGVECIIYSATLVLFRNHLFIWSVFVPKLLYLLSQSVMHFILSIIYLFL